MSIKFGSEKEIDPPLATWLREKKRDINSIPFIENPSIISHIIIHHSLTKDGKEVNWEAIRKYHVEVNGWNYIGYHAGTEAVKDDYQVVLGRSLDKRGAHVKDGGFNKHSIGICVIGNWDLEKPPIKQWVLTLILVNRFIEYFASKGIIIKPSNVIGHREAQAEAGVSEFNRKTCPGKLFSMDQFRFDLGQDPLNILRRDQI